MSRDRFAKTVTAIKNDGLYIDGVRFPFHVGREMEVVEVNDGAVFGVQLTLFADEVVMFSKDGDREVRTVDTEPDAEWMAMVHRGKLLEMADQIGVFGPDGLKGYAEVLIDAQLFYDGRTEARRQVRELEATVAYLRRELVEAERRVNLQNPVAVVEKMLETMDVEVKP